jgi:dihydrofolate reductase
MSLPRYVALVETYGHKVTQRSISGREVFVLADNTLSLPASTAKTVSSLDEAVEKSTREKIICIGGSDIHKMVFDKLDYIYYNMFHDDYGCDEFATELLDNIHAKFEKVETVSLSDDLTHFVFKRVRK